MFANFNVDNLKLTLKIGTRQTITTKVRAYESMRLHLP